MTVPTFHDRELTAIAVGELISVAVFCWACVSLVKNKLRYFNARLAAAFLILVPCSIEALIRINDEIEIASVYPTDDFYTNLHRILEIKRPLVFGLSGFAIMLFVHSTLWWFHCHRKPVLEHSHQT